MVKGLRNSSVSMFVPDGFSVYTITFPSEPGRANKILQTLGKSYSDALYRAPGINPDSQEALSVALPENPRQKLLEANLGFQFSSQKRPLDS